MKRLSFFAFVVMAAVFAASCQFSPDMSQKGYVPCASDADCNTDCVCASNGYCLPPEGSLPSSCKPEAPVVCQEDSDCRNVCTCEQGACSPPAGRNVDCNPLLPPFVECGQAGCSEGCECSDGFCYDERDQPDECHGVDPIYCEDDGDCRNVCTCEENICVPLEGHDLGVEDCNHALPAYVECGETGCQGGCTCDQGLCWPDGGGSPDQCASLDGYPCASEDDCRNVCYCQQTLGICLPLLGEMTKQDCDPELDDYLTCTSSDDCSPLCPCDHGLGLCIPFDGVELEDCDRGLYPPCSREDECRNICSCVDGLCIPPEGLDPQRCTTIETPFIPCGPHGSDDCPGDCTCTDGYCIPPDGWDPKSCLHPRDELVLCSGDSQCHLGCTCQQGVCIPENWDHGAAVCLLPDPDVRPWDLPRQEWSTTITVTTNTDNDNATGVINPDDVFNQIQEGGISLREAIHYANAKGGDIRIDFEEPMAISIAESPIGLEASDVFIDAADKSVTISSALRDPPLEISGDRIALRDIGFSNTPNAIALDVSGARAVYLKGLEFHDCMTALRVQNSRQVILSNGYDCPSCGQPGDLMVHGCGGTGDHPAVELIDSEVTISGAVFEGNTAEGLRISGASSVIVGPDPNLDFLDFQPNTFRLHETDAAIGLDESFSGSLTLRNSVFVSNHVDVSIDGSGQIALAHCTSLANGYAVIELWAASGNMTLDFYNAIVAFPGLYLLFSHSPESQEFDCGGLLLTDPPNCHGGGGALCSNLTYIPTNAMELDALLDPITYAPLPGTEAIDAAESYPSGSTSWDVSGRFDGQLYCGEGPDIGAVESCGD
ncbi:MAG: hypothetical protein JXR96_27705 [Deltaproteobacteria bacterium]|nr:hypothetical protein [Deltaproteobacteria bacterium]